ncbi:MAG: hypothetical protein GY765_09335 [bacterium]|nr:hypothetical protein [bacterium]
MRTLADIRESILDYDGTTRDIDFTPVSRDSLVDFMEVLLRQYSLDWAYNEEGEEQTAIALGPDKSELFSAPEGYLHITFRSDSAMIPLLQMLLDWPEAGGFTIQLFLYPEGLDSEFFQVKEFMAMVDSWNDVLKADDYSVSYEYAGWGYRRGPGTIYTGSEYKLYR